MRRQVLAEPVSDSRGGFAATLVAVGAVVRPGQLERGRVVVQPGEVDVERLHRIQDQTGQQAGPIRVEQSGQHPPDTVVVE